MTGLLRLKLNNYIHIFISYACYFFIFLELQVEKLEFQPKFPLLLVGFDKLEEEIRIIRSL